MKILIADEDDSSRTLLSRLLSRYMGCEVWEAADGFDALASIESAHPDVIVCDVQIPRLDGLAVVDVVRASPAFASTTAILTGKRATRALLDRAQGLGVRHFLLKPIDVEDVRRRFTRLISQLPASTRPLQRVDEDAVDLGPPSLLLVDGDPNFRRFALPILQGRFRIHEATTGAEAMAMLQREPFDIVCIGDELRLLRDTLLAGALRMHQHGSHSRLFRICGREHDPVQPPFEGTIERTFIPTNFVRSVHRVILGETTVAERLRILAGDELRRELVSAVQQTLGVLASLGAHERLMRSEGLASPLRTEVTLEAPGSGAAVAIDLLASMESAGSLARSVLRKPTVDESEIRDLLLELANMVGGRMRESLMLRGHDFKLGFPRIVDADESAKSDGAVHLETDDGDRLTARMFILEDHPNSMGDHDSFDAVLF